MNEDKEYIVVTFKATSGNEVVNQEPQLSKDKNNPIEEKTNEEVVSGKVDKSMAKAIGTASMIYGYANILIKPTLQKTMNSALASGESQQAQVMQRDLAVFNELTNLGFSAAVGFAAAGPIGLLAVGASYGLSKGQQLISNEINNQLLRENNQTEMLVNAMNASRFIREVTDKR